MINIVICSEYQGTTGGIETWLDQYCSYLTELGVAHRVICINASDGTSADMDILPSYRGWTNMISWSVLCLFRFFKSRKDLRSAPLLVLGTLPAALPVIIARKLQIINGKIILSVRGTIYEDGIFLKRNSLASSAIYFLERFVLRHADSIICNGQDTAEYVYNNYHLAACVVHNGISTKRFSELSAPKKHSRDGKINILFCATGRYIKGYYHAQELVKRIPDKYVNDVHFTFVGKGMKSRFEAEHVSYLGEKKDVLECYRSADIVLNLSGGGGVSNTLLESLASGAVVVCWDLNLYKYVCNAYEGVFYAKAWDVDDLVRVLAALLKPGVLKPCERYNRCMLRYDSRLLFDDYLRICQS